MDLLMVCPIIFFSWEPLAQGRENGEDPKVLQNNGKQLPSGSPSPYKWFTHLNHVLTYLPPFSFHCFPIIRIVEDERTGRTWIYTFISKKYLQCNAPSTHALTHLAELLPCGFHWLILKIKVLNSQKLRKLQKVPCYFPVIHAEKNMSPSASLCEESICFGWN